FRCYSSCPLGVSSSTSGGGGSRRSSSLLATNRAPPIFPEARIRLAIHRRAVRIDTPESRAMSRARRYSLSPVISASPDQGALVRRHARAPAQPIRGRLAAPGGGQAPPARLKPDWRLSTDLGEPEPCPPEHGNQSRHLRNGAIESIFFGAAPPVRTSLIRPAKESGENWMPMGLPAVF